MAIDQFGQIIRRSPRPIPIQTNNTVDYSSVNTTHTRRLTRWERFDNFIIGIGNWIAETSDTIIGIITLLVVAAIAIPFVIWLFSLGLIWGIVAGVLLGGLVYYATMIVAGIFVCIANIVLAIFRYIFYSGKSFLITLAIIGGFIAYNAFSPKFTSSSATEYTTTQTTPYRCTASSGLRLHSQPNQDSDVVGKLDNGEIVYVSEIVDGFAKIEINDGESYGYASIRYLEKQDSAESEKP